jgi:hypothetical protein
MRMHVAAEDMLQATLSVATSEVFSVVMSALEEAAAWGPGTSGESIKQLLAETTGDQVNYVLTLLEGLLNSQEIGLTAFGWLTLD